jgi:hypothetical protein
LIVEPRFMIGAGACYIYDLKSRIADRIDANIMPALHKRSTEPASVVADAAGLGWIFSAKEGNLHTNGDRWRAN